MRTRSQELRARSRRMFAVSYLIAAMLVGGLFLWSPKYDVKPLESTETEPTTSGVIPTSPLFVHARYGPPEIFETDGTSWEESRDRVLEVGRVVDLPAECREAFVATPLPVSGCPDSAWTVRATPSCWS